VLEKKMLPGAVEDLHFREKQRNFAVLNRP